MRQCLVCDGGYVYSGPDDGRPRTRSECPACDGNEVIEVDCPGCSAGVGELLGRGATTEPWALALDLGHTVDDVCLAVESDLAVARMVLPSDEMRSLLASRDAVVPYATMAFSPEPATTGYPRLTDTFGDLVRFDVAWTTLESLDPVDGAIRVGEGAMLQPVTGPSGGVPRPPWPVVIEGLRTIELLEAVSAARAAPAAAAVAEVSAATVEATWFARLAPVVALTVSAHPALVVLAGLSVGLRDGDHELNRVGLLEPPVAVHPIGEPLPAPPGYQEPSGAELLDKYLPALDQGLPVWLPPPAVERAWSEMERLVLSPPPKWWSEPGPDASPQAWKAFLDRLPRQVHHVLSDKSRTGGWTDRARTLLRELDLKLSDDWNLTKIPHSGTHPWEYHTTVLGVTEQILERVFVDHSTKAARRVAFIEQFRADLVEPLTKNPEMCRYSYYRRPGE